MTDEQLSALTRAATPGPWTAIDGAGQYAHEVWAANQRGKPFTVARIASGIRHRESDASHIAAWNPKRALAAIECLHLLRESQDSIGGDWRARRDAALAAWDALP